jgi:hypothetical protein
MPALGAYSGTLAQPSVLALDASRTATSCRIRDEMLTTATTDAAGGTRTLLSDRLAWLVLMPDEQVVSSGKVGPFKWAFTRAVLIDATSGDYLGGALLPSSDWR